MHFGNVFLIMFVGNGNLAPIPVCCQHECLSRKFDYSRVNFGSMTSLLRHSHAQMHKYEREDKLRDLLRIGVTGQSDKGVLHVV